MTKWNIDTGKKVTGGRIHLHRKKRRFQRGSLALLTEVGKSKKRSERIRGGGEKVKLVKAEFVNAIDPKTNKIKKVKILDVVSNSANPHYIRRGIITKGAIVKTDLGSVKILSRPSQSGIVSGIILEKESK